MWHLCAAKNGLSALNLQRQISLGSYYTAWLCRHKLRRVMVQPGMERLSGEVEVDATYVGGPTEGKRGWETKQRLYKERGKRVGKVFPGR